MEIEINKMYLLLFGAVLTVLLIIIELYWSERTYSISLKKRSYFANLLLFGFNNVVFFAFNITAIYLLAYNYRLHDLFTAVPLWVQTVIGILLLDLAIWAWHVFNHRVPLLWRFHKCHHSEQYLNASSAIRFHIGELFLSVLFKAGILILLGLPLWIFILYESLITFFALFHHANLHLPHGFQKKLSWIIITPDMHRTHHSSLRPEHDSNYGVIFSWWDRMFTTYKTVQPKVIGLQNVEEKSFLKILMFPFRRG